MYLHFPIHFPMHFAKEGKRRKSSKKTFPLTEPIQFESVDPEFEYHHSQIKLFLLFPSLPVFPCLVLLLSRLVLARLALALACLGSKHNSWTGAQHTKPRQDKKSAFLSCLDFSCLVLSCLVLSLDSCLFILVLLPLHSPFIFFPLNSCHPRPPPTYLLAQNASCQTRVHQAPTITPP